MHNNLLELANLLRLLALDEPDPAKARIWHEQADATLDELREAARDDN